MTTDAMESHQTNGQSWLRATAIRRHFALLHLGPALLIAVLLAVLEQTSIDDMVSGWFFDRIAAVFPLRYNSFLEVFAHQYVKQLVIVVACCVIAMYLLSFVLTELKPRRRLLLFLSLSFTLAPLAVVLLKVASVRHCPWNLLEYGGFAPHLTLFDAVPADLSPGHCFPAGHASTGFCLMAFYFAARAFDSRLWAGIGLAGSIVLGLALGLGRVAQGAHFLSHVLWSGLVCWLVIVALHYALLPRTR